MDALRDLASAVERHAGPAPFGAWFHEGLGLRIGATHVAPEPSQPAQHPVFALVVQGEKRVALADEVITCGEGSCVVTTGMQPLSFRISRASHARPYIALAMPLGGAEIASFLLEAPAEAHGSVGSGAAPPLRLGAADASLIEALGRLLRLADQPRDIPMLAPVIRREIFWRLLCSEQGDSLRAIALADERLGQIGRALALMRDHYRDPLPIPSLARASAMSVTSFHRHFRAVTSMSPVQYLKKLRLQQARTLLLGRTEDVAGVGHAVGYDSPSQFSREYKRAYGLAPGQDARRLRTS